MEITKIAYSLRKIAYDLAFLETNGTSWSSKGAENAHNQMIDLAEAIEDELADARAQAKEDKEYMGHLLEPLVVKLD